MLPAGPDGSFMPRQRFGYARLHALACHALGIRHLLTRPYRPRTNGKAERFIRTVLAGWATAPSTPAHSSAPPRSPFGSTTTTTDDPTAPSATTRRQHASRN